MVCATPSFPVGGTITVALADDHRMVRAALRALLEEQTDIEVVGDVGDAAAALQCVVDERPAVLVLDLTMPGDLTALHCIERVRQDAPATAMVVLTMQGDPAFARRAIRLGATGYVLKEGADDELVDAIRRAAAGEPYVTPQVADAIAARPPAHGPMALSPRELEVLGLLALGHTNAEIAERLVLSVRTVESHRVHIRRKLADPSRAELVRCARDLRLLGF